MDDHNNDKGFYNKDYQHQHLEKIVVSPNTIAAAPGGSE